MASQRSLLTTLAIVFLVTSFLFFESSSARKLVTKEKDRSKDSSSSSFSSSSQNKLSSIYHQEQEKEVDTIPVKTTTTNDQYDNSTTTMTTGWISLPQDGSPLASCGIGSINLSPMTRSGSDYTFSPPNEGTFYINICGVASGGGCTASGVSVCQKATNGVGYNNGVYSAMQITQTGGNVVVTYGGGQACGSVSRQTVITISCDQNAGQGTITGIVASTCANPYQVAMKSQYVCSSGGSTKSKQPASTKSSSLSRGASPSATPTEVNPGGGGGFNYGWIFVIIVLVSFFVYLVAGFVYKKKREGTQGFVESIPNIEFWKDLPFLVKDGFLFVFNKLRSLVSRGSYTPL